MSGWMSRLAAGSTDQCKTRSAGGLAQIHSNIPDSATRRATKRSTGLMEDQFIYFLLLTEVEFDSGRSGSGRDAFCKLVGSQLSV